MHPGLCCRFLQSYLSLHNPPEERILPIPVFAVWFERAVCIRLAGSFRLAPSADVQQLLIDESLFAERAGVGVPLVQLPAGAVADRAGALDSDEVFQRF